MITKGNETADKPTAIQQKIVYYIHLCVLLANFFFYSALGFELWTSLTRQVFSQLEPLLQASFRL
jgi:hypothetical protein